jgi:REP element-mobilizing transposase RayT
MPAYPRREIVPGDEVGVYHCVARCVRRAFLCGADPVTGHDYEHRKHWIRERLEQLAGIFAIDICGYAVMSNHLHLVLRARPDLVEVWSDLEIALRWKRLFPPRDPATAKPIELSECDLNMIVSNPARILVLREQLSNLSWFMRCLSEPIARRANREDQCTGRFWEGRFKSQALLDEAAILACSVYVDLNPIRAGVAETPEQSEYTSAFDRIRSRPTTNSSAMSSHEPLPASLPTHVPTAPSSPVVPPRADSWLCELPLQEGSSASPKADSPAAVNDSRLATTEATETACEHRVGPNRAVRASDQGYLPIGLDQYLSLLDWTGRQLRAGSRGTIPAGLAPILERLGVIGDGWVETVRQFGRWFKTAVGRRVSLAHLAVRRGKAWLQGQSAAALAFR